MRRPRPSFIQKWIGDNSPDHQRGTPGDSWRAYLKANGGTGETRYDQEQAYMRINSLNEITDVFQGAVGNYYVQEDGLSKYMLEDGSGSYILE